MDKRRSQLQTPLIGIGLYTPAEAGRLLRISPSKIVRWLCGHEAGGRRYEPLWRPQIDLGNDGICLGFRDLQEIRIASAFIDAGLSAYRVRQAMVLARTIVPDERPLSTTRFGTDGRSIFLQIIENDGQAKLIDIFNKQYAFREILERSLTNLDYDSEGVPTKWWPLGYAKSIVLDPTRSFGQPIEAETSVPVAALVAAVKAEGSIEATARIFDVPKKAVNRALAYERQMRAPLAA